MPRINCKIEKPNGEKFYVEAKGFFFLILNVSSRKSILKKLVREYDCGED